MERKSGPGMQDAHTWPIIITRCHHMQINDQSRDLANADTVSYATPHSSRTPSLIPEHIQRATLHRRHGSKSLHLTLVDMRKGGSAKRPGQILGPVHSHPHPHPFKNITATCRKADNQPIQPIQSLPNLGAVRDVESPDPRRATPQGRQTPQPHLSCTGDPSHVDPRACTYLADASDMLQWRVISCGATALLPGVPLDIVHRLHERVEM
jgi:hypothetical protein